MSHDEVSTFWDDYETFEIDFDPKLWKAELNLEEGEIILHRKGSTKSW